MKKTLSQIGKLAELEKKPKTTKPQQNSLSLAKLENFMKLLK